ncbi:MAG: adenylate/guanylate cyclase domain-containing protein, partial [Bacteroidota bacterium]
NIAQVYYSRNDHIESLKYAFDALKLVDSANDKRGLVLSCINIGANYTKQRKFNDATEYLNKALTTSKQMGNLDLMKQSYDFFAKLDSSQGNFNKALEHYKLYIIFRDSLVNTENIKKTAALQMNFEMNKKEKEIDLLKSQQEIDRLNKSKTLGIIFGMGGALLGMISLVLVFYQQRNKISKEKKISEKERERSDELLLNILPAEVANELKQKGSSDARDYEEVTVMFTDFKDFTKISEGMSPSSLVKEIDYCFSAFDNIIHKHGIEKIKTIGDAYMCAGGLPVANKTHAEDTVKAALEIRDFMANHNKEKLAKGELPFEIRIGINTGPVVAGIVGVKKFAYDIWGDTVNLASRMESSGEAGKVNISGSTYELIKDKFICSHRGKIQTKNKGEVDMYFVE